MIVWVSFQKALLVRQFLLCPEELLVALPGLATLIKTSFRGERSTLFPVHKVVKEYPGMGCLFPPKTEETSVFCLQAEEYPTRWDSHIGFNNPEAPSFTFLRVRVGRALRVRAYPHEILLPIPDVCKLAPFKNQVSDLRPNLFDPNQYEM